VADTTNIGETQLEIVQPTASLIDKSTAKSNAQPIAKPTDESLEARTDQPSTLLTDQPNRERVANTDKNFDWYLKPTNTDWYSLIEVDLSYQKLIDNRWLIKKDRYLLTDLNWLIRTDNYADLVLGLFDG